MKKILLCLLLGLMFLATFPLGVVSARILADLNTTNPIDPGSRGTLLITEIHVDTNNPRNSYVELLNYKVPTGSNFMHGPNTPNYILLNSIDLSYKNETNYEQHARLNIPMGDPDYASRDWRNDLLRTVHNDEVCAFMEAEFWDSCQNIVSSFDFWYLAPGEHVRLYLPITSKFTIVSLSYQTMTDNSNPGNGYEKYYQDYALTVSTQEMRDRVISGSTVTYEIDKDFYLATGRADVFKIANMQTPWSSPMNIFGTANPSINSTGFWIQNNGMPGTDLPPHPVFHPMNGNNNIAMCYVDPNDPFQDICTPTPKEEPEVEIVSTPPIHGGFGTSIARPTERRLPVRENLIASTTPVPPSTPDPTEMPEQQTGEGDEEIEATISWLTILLIIFLFLVFLFILFWKRRRKKENEEQQPLVD